MIKKTLFCKQCGDLHEHDETGAELKVGNAPVKVVFGCTQCGQKQVQEFSKSEYFGLPLETATHFKCDHCNIMRNHSVARVARGHKQAWVVLHCNECNAEVRNLFSVDAIPQEILEVEPPNPRKPVVDSSAAS